MIKQLMSTGWWAAFYTVTMIVMLIVAGFLLDWQAFGALAGFGVICWLAGGQTAAWASNDRMMK